MTKVTREKLVFLSNSLRHLNNTANYLSDELERLIKWLDKVIAELKDEDDKEKEA